MSALTDFAVADGLTAAETAAIEYFLRHCRLPEAADGVSQTHPQALLSIGIALCRDSTLRGLSEQSLEAVYSPESTSSHFGKTSKPPVSDEIEITPEMIEEGAEVILAAYGGLDLRPCPSVVAERVFLAMCRLASATP